MKARIGCSGTKTWRVSSRSAAAGVRSRVTSVRNLARSMLANDSVTRPLWPRARNRRFWDRRVKWRTSSSALPIASRYSSDGRSSSSTTSSEPRRTVSGVRSSCETSAMNCCCSFSAAATASSRPFKRSASSLASPERSADGIRFKGYCSVSGEPVFQGRQFRGGRRALGPLAEEAQASSSVSPRTRYPTPRTVWISLSRSPESIFLRSALM